MSDGVSCLCLTYGRPNLLEEGVESFLRQQWKGPKELIVLNDHPDQTLVFEHPEVVIINLPRRLKTLGEKRNLSVALAKYDNLLVWDDDDIYLPHRIQQTMKTLPDKQFYKCPNAWIMTDGKIANFGCQLFHGGSAYTRWLFERTGGYRPISLAEDADIESRFEHSSDKVSEYYSHTLLPVHQMYYIYRWGHGGYHTSGVSDILSSINPKVTKGVIELHPAWRLPYELLAAKAAADMQAKMNAPSTNARLNMHDLVNIDLAYIRMGGGTIVIRLLSDGTIRKNGKGPERTWMSDGERLSFFDDHGQIVGKFCRAKGLGFFGNLSNGADASVMPTFRPI